MINLLPPDIKAEVGYAKRSRRLQRYFWLSLGVIVILAIALASGFWYVSRRIAKADQELARKQQTIAGYHDIETQVKAVNSRLSTIKTLSASQAHFSLVLADIAAHTPSSAYITALSLTGDDKKPVHISANTDSYATAANFRASLAASPRIRAIDILSVSNPAAGQYHVELIASYKPGQAK